LSNFQPQVDIFRFVRAKSDAYCSLNRSKHEDDEVVEIAYFIGNRIELFSTKNGWDLWK